MSKLLMLCCTLAVFVIMGCSEDENPVHSGSTTFAISDFVPDGAVGTIYDMKMTITTTTTFPGLPKQEQTIEGVASFTILERDVMSPDGKHKGIKGLNYTDAANQVVIDTIYYAATSEGVWVYQEQRGYTPTFLVKAPIKVGTEWASEFAGVTSNTKITSINEQVKVPTGSYSAIKLNTAISSSNPAAMSQTTWITKGIGFVKSIGEAKVESGSVTAVTTTTTELIKITKK